MSEEEFNKAIELLKAEIFNNKQEIRAISAESRNMLDQLNVMQTKMNKMKEMFSLEITEVKPAAVNHSYSTPLSTTAERYQNEVAKPSNTLLKLMEVENYIIGSYNLNTRTCILTHGNKSTKLTQKEMAILALFAANINKLVLRSECLSVIWDKDNYSNSRSRDVYLSKLRKLLQDDKSIQLVNVHGKGHLLSV